MARTRQTARKSTSGGIIDASNLCSVPQNKELLKKMIHRNCMSMMKSSLTNVVKEDKVDIQTKFAPYRDCLKLARLWILQDLMKDHNNPPSRDEVDENELSSLLSTIPMDIKMEIIAFIPTFTHNCHGLGKQYEQQGALRETISVRDPWFYCYFKHRAISKTVQEYFEQLVCKRMATDTLDLSIFLLNLTPSNLKNRFKFLDALVKSQSKFIENKKTEFKFHPVTRTTHSPSSNIYNHIPAQQPEIPKYNETEFDFDNMDWNELEKYEKNFIQEIPTGLIAISTPFQEDPRKSMNMWALPEHAQDNARNEIHNALTYFGEEDDEEYSETYSEDEDETAMGNTSIKKLSCNLSENNLEKNSSLAALIYKLEALEVLEINMEDLYDGYRSLMTFSNSIGDAFDRLQRLNINFFENLSGIQNNLAMIRLDRVKNVYLRAIIDDTSLTSTCFSAFNVFIDNKRVTEYQETRSNLYISSIDPSDFRHSENPLLAKTIGKIIPSTILEMHQKKEIIETIIKRFPSICMCISSYLCNNIQYPSAMNLLQYTIYLANKYHNGVIFSSFQLGFPRETSIAQLIYGGWDLSANILDMACTMGQEFTEIILDHWHELIKLGHYKFDINNIKLRLLPAIRDKSCRVLGFICDNCSYEEKLELFRSIKYGETQFGYFKTSLFNHLVATCDESGVLFIVNRVPAESLLEKSQRQTPKKRIECTALNYAIENPRLSNELIEKIIERQPLLVHIADNEGTTPLHQICRKPHRWPLIPAILKYNPDTNPKDIRNETPLDYGIKFITSFKVMFPYWNELAQQ